jgi:hypothetical protein
MWIADYAITRKLVNKCNTFSVSWYSITGQSLLSSEVSRMVLKNERHDNDKSCRREPGEMARNLITLIFFFGPYFGVMLAVVFNIVRRAMVPYETSEKVAAPIGLPSHNPSSMPFLSQLDDPASIS